VRHCRRWTSSSLAGAPCSSGPDAAWAGRTLSTLSLREKIGQLVITKNADLDDDASKALAAEIEKMAFNPWNCTEDFRPLGSIMRARKDVYAASASHRGACPFGFGR